MSLKAKGGKEPALTDAAFIKNGSNAGSERCRISVSTERRGPFRSGTPHYNSSNANIDQRRIIAQQWKFLGDLKHDLKIDFVVLHCGDP